MSQKLFNALGKVHDFFKNRAWLTKPVHNLLEKWVPTKNQEDQPWEEEAEAELMEQMPLRAKKMLYAVALVLFVLLLWASLAKVDEVTRGEGKVVPSRQVQVIQSLDGGIVSAILVHEGQTVSVGDPLVRIDETRAISSLRENRSQAISLLAKQARLQALSEDKPFNPPSQVEKDYPEVYAQEYGSYISSRNALASQIGMARDQLTQRERELSEVQAKMEQAERGLDLVTQELTLTRPLINSGAVSEVDLLRLERQAAQLRGERQQARAQIGRVQASIGEANRKISETGQSSRSKVRAELSETTAKLNSISETSVALNDKVVQSTLKSPVNGTVSRLYSNTVGGVIQPGKEVLEVVPSDDTLVLETKIQLRDIAFITLNQPATVKLTAYDYIIYGILEAKVVGVSADSQVDEKGNAYYIVRVRTFKSNLGKDLPIIPGMAAQVDIMTGKKTVLSYLLKPVLRARSYAFTER
ncbi:HlyD family type I secretion periplasmic adaptor subunit [Methylobacter svalbardensis]|uniref:HlyD family type I secretion periplasmic adaptor subunit n=1 Tax=Methylobacter svalbardensis TaxID=3080016 RepID=UPI0030EC4A20